MLLMNLNFFKPKSIAVIGASADTKKLGFTIIKNLKDSGFKGRIYPINNKADEDSFILDLKVYPSINAIHETPELVVISIPVDLVFEELLKSYAEGVRNFVIISAGFKEIGNTKAENFLKQFLETHHDVNILGPNCLGFIDTSTPINASFAASFPKEGKLSFFSQSGALCTAVLDWSEKLGMGFSKFISLGNKNNISENTFLEEQYLDNNPAFFYLESFVDGKEFIEKSRKIKSPIVLLHPGKYSETASAMQSQTGSIASNDRIVSEALEEAGVIRANGLEDIMDLMMIFNFYPKYQKLQNVAIVSNAGGAGIITTDAIKNQGLNLAQLSPSTMKLLSEKLPRTANIHNPVDVVGDALADRYGYALDIVLADSNVDAVIVLLTPQAMTQIDLTAEYIQRLSKQHGKVVVASFMGGKKVDRYEHYLFMHGVPYFDYPERAVWALSKLNEAQITRIFKGSNYTNEQLSLLLSKEGTKGWLSSGSLSDNITDSIEETNPLTPPYLAEARDFVQGEEKQEDIDSRLHGNDTDLVPSRRDPSIPQDDTDPNSKFYIINSKLTPSHLVNSLTQVKIPAEQTITTISDLEQFNPNNEIALKIISDQMWHKTDSGGVKLHLKTIDERRIAYEELKTLGEKQKLDNPNFDYSIQAQEMIKMDYELFLGAKRDPNFGNVVAFGIGGIYANIINENMIFLEFATPEYILEKIKKSKVGEILSGARGQEAVNLEKIVKTILELHQAMKDFETIQEVDINPLGVAKQEIYAIDIKIKALE
jgi:acyl-CoA synthetase (NDP forming)